MSSQHVFPKCLWQAQKEGGALWGLSDFICEMKGLQRSLGFRVPPSSEVLGFKIPLREGEAPPWGGQLPAPPLTWPRSSSIQACAPGATRGPSNPKSSYKPLGGVCVCVTNTVIPLTLHHSWVSALPPAHCPVPRPHSSVSGGEADACLDGVIWRKSPHTPQNISLTDLPEILITGTRFLCIQASCFQKFPVKGKRAQKCNMYSAFEFLFPSATVSSLTFTSSRHHSPDPPKHLTNRKTSPTRTEAWNPNFWGKS